MEFTFSLREKDKIRVHREINSKLYSMVAKSMSCR